MSLTSVFCQHVCWGDGHAWCFFSLIPLGIPVVFEGLHIGCRLYRRTFSFCLPACTCVRRRDRNTRQVSGISVRFRKFSSIFSDRDLPGRAERASRVSTIIFGEGGTGRSSALVFLRPETWDLTPGSTFFVRRPVGGAIVGTFCRASTRTRRRR